MDNLFEQQLINISKAGAYDVLVQQVGELKATNREMTANLEIFENKICELYNRLRRETECDPTFKGKEIWEEEKLYIETVTEPIIKKAKLLSL